MAYAVRRACATSGPAVAEKQAEQQTVCTITVNSADEKETFRRYLPETRYRFVELVERNRPDWLASACKAAVSCDVLVISGHYDGGNEFFSDRLEAREFLPVAELERASCSDSCPALFSRLKEVYLFGCDTLNPDPHSGAAAEVLRSLVREGHSPKQAQRHIGEARLYLDRIEPVMASLDKPARRTPAVTRALENIARDTAARARFLDYARAADQPAVRTRLVNLARNLGWLSEHERRDELAQMLGEMLDRPTLGVAEVGLACELNQGGDLDAAFNRRVGSRSPAVDVSHAAVRACLGSIEGRARTLQGSTNPNEAEVRIAQAYLRHRPITDPAELRRLTADIARMPASGAQASALEALGRHYVSDRELMKMLARLFARTPSWSVQSAIAGILLRADRVALGSPQLVHTLLENRLPSPGGDNVIDALIRRLQSP